MPGCQPTLLDEELTRARAADARGDRIATPGPSPEPLPGLGRGRELDKSDSP